MMSLFGHLAAGRGVIFALPHMGNYEHAGAWIVRRGAGSFTTVAERLRPVALYQRLLSFRESGDEREKIAIMSQQMAHVFAQGISDHPQDWHMLQKVSGRRSRPGPARSRP